MPRPHPVRIALALALATATRAAPPAHDGEVLVGLGRFHKKPPSALASHLEFRSGRHGSGDSGVFLALTTTSRRGLALALGAYTDIDVGRDLAFTPSFGVAWYVRGRGRDLGHPLVFRSGFQLGLRVEERLRVGLAYHHLSNWRLGEDNPGAETFLPVVAFPSEELH
jgi:hypothetical protein